MVAMIRSTLPLTISGMRVFDRACTNFALTPRSLAISLARSTSKPSGWPVSLLMKPIGGESYLTPTIISPFCLTLSSTESTARASGTAKSATTRAATTSASLRMAVLLVTSEQEESRRRERLRQPVEVLLSFVERAHEQPLVASVRANVVDVTEHSGCAIGGDASRAQKSRVGRAGGHRGDDRHARPHRRRHRLHGVHHLGRQR